MVHFSYIWRTSPFPKRCIKPHMTRHLLIIRHINKKQYQDLAAFIRCFYRMFLYKDSGISGYRIYIYARFEKFLSADPAGRRSDVDRYAPLVGLLWSPDSAVAGVTSTDTRPWLVCCGASFVQTYRLISFLFPRGCGRPRARR